MSHPRESTTSARRLQTLERALKAVELRKAGLSYIRIGAELGISKQAACVAVRKQMEIARERLTLSTLDLIELDAARLDSLLSSQWAKAMAGHLGAHDRVLRTMEARWELLGMRFKDRIAANPPQPEAQTITIRFDGRDEDVPVAIVPPKEIDDGQG